MNISDTSGQRDANDDTVLQVEIESCIMSCIFRLTVIGRHGIPPGVWFGLHD
jgi:hypothetical protein